MSVMFGKILGLRLLIHGYPNGKPLTLQLKNDEDNQRVLCN